MTKGQAEASAPLEGAVEPRANLARLSRRALEYLAARALEGAVPAPADPELRKELQGCCELGPSAKPPSELVNALRSGAFSEVRAFTDASALSGHWSELLREATSEGALVSLYELALRAGDEGRRWLAQQPTEGAGDGRVALIVEAWIRLGETERARGLLSAHPHTGRLGLLYGELLLEHGEPDDALDILTHLSLQGQAAVQRDLRVARALFFLGRQSAACTLAGRLSDRVDKLELEPRQRAWFIDELTRLRIHLGMPCPSVTLSGPPRLGMGLQLAASGHLQRAAAVLQSIRTGRESTDRVRILASLFEGIGRIACGDYSGLVPAAKQLRLETERAGSATLYPLAVLLERTAALSDVHAYPHARWSPKIAHPSGVLALYLRAIDACYKARAGLPVSPADLPQPTGEGIVRCICDLARALVELLQGDARRAAILASHVAEQTDRVGHRFLVGEARLIAAVAAVHAGVDGPRRVAALQMAAEDLRSARYDAFARLLRGAAASEPDVPTLLALRGAAGLSPSVERIARRLLGGEVRLDAYDSLVVKAVSQHWRSHVQSLDGSARWTFDPATRVVQLPGRSVRVGPTAANVLESLFVSGGRCDLESRACQFQKASVVR
ncbi:MAG: hypothetical protein AAF411_29850, partial [Myxococcota bacterium]